MKSFYLLCLAWMLGTTAHATIIVQAEWTLGESDGAVGTNPATVSASVGIDFRNASGGSTVGDTAPAAVGSTSYLSLNGAQGYFNTDLSTLPTDNIAIELWARPAGSTGVGKLFTSGNSGTWFDIQQRDGNWGASVNGVSWIGGTSGAGQPLTPGTWSHLAIIRNSGVATFYIDGVAQAGAAPTNVPVLTNAHLGVNPGGANRYNGDLDDLRIFSFDPINDDPVAALSINAIPEPSSTALLLMSGALLCSLRRLRK